MACLNMQINNEQQQGGGFLGPRISFSNDFGDTQQTTQPNNNMKHNTTYREAPVSSEFNFAVPCFASNSADEIFFKAKILPLKENNKASVLTLRDELLNDDDDDDIFLPKSSGWWKFGRSQTQSVNHNACLATKKGDHKNHGGLETIDEGNQYLRK
uniref:uncharacterized protein LOC122594211 n=1 Tax=Erigeron canadensis TaxID=72917 RepID=UPI001CB8FB43|nr:uncharacterized protein LOC122594211 [Erigeron canadensis]